MSETRDKLYRAFQIAYEKWASAPRPKAPKEDLTLTYDEVQTLGHFREGLWQNYIEARDAYLFYLKHGNIH